MPVTSHPPHAPKPTPPNDTSFQLALPAASLVSILPMPEFGVNCIAFGFTVSVLTLPATCNFSVGVLVPMPTLF
jgi:hypothetical protein